MTVPVAVLADTEVAVSADTEVAVSEDTVAVDLVVTAAEWEEVGFVSNLSRDFLLYTDTVIKNALGTNLKVVLVVNRLW